MRSNESLGVVGLGEVGLRLAIAFTDAGFDVLGVDVDAERTAALNHGSSYISDIPDTAVQSLTANGFEATTKYDRLTEVSHVAVCVPTPLQKSGQPDISYIVSATESLAAVIEPETTVIIESTVYPTATERAVSGVFEDAGFTVGEDVFLASSPERVDPGNDAYSLTEIPKIVGGVTPQCGDHVEALYGEVFETIKRVDSSTEAEMAKILENTFRNVNIALVNELAKVADNFDIDFWRVIEAAETKPYGFMPFYPGPGLGGHCIPVDPMYISWKAKQDGLKTPLIDLADTTNREMPSYVVTRIIESLNDRGVPVPDADVMVLGVTYKPNVADIRNSPALDIIEELEAHDASISFHDPYVDTVEVHNNGTYESTALTAERLSAADCVVIATDHSQFDFDFVVEHSEFVFDTRNATEGRSTATIERL
ncbi:nucleotide sugar dehydrogenase [Haloarcula sp. CGMCC 1.2071]|uniref:nucleotide sugar dehydrogenase n=1 Tax=Haloarcula sp. CGMCC 1.2071 TaxID=3111454 RepID=UPI00300ED5A1